MLNMGYLVCRCDFVKMCMHAAITRSQGFSHIFIGPSQRYTCFKDTEVWIKRGECRQVINVHNSLHGSSPFICGAFHVFACRSPVDYNPGILI